MICSFAASSGSGSPPRRDQRRGLGARLIDEDHDISGAVLARARQRSPTRFFPDLIWMNSPGDPERTAGLRGAGSSYSQEYGCSPM